MGHSGGIGSRDDRENDHMRVLIVGGGSAGWITAAYLDRSLNGNGPKEVLIGVVESARIGRIGVGEATIPTMKRTLARIGISERDFLIHADATFKQAIRFDDWLEEGHHYYHPFDRLTAAKFDRYGLRYLASDRSKAFAEMVSPQPAICDAGLSPKKSSDGDYEGQMPYAYHMDAEKFADFLRDTATSRGVHHMTDDVVDVERRENGDVAAVKTASGKRIEADLFIDCSGFARLLIGKTLGVPYEEFGDYLLCDSAVAMQVPYDVYKRDNVRPYTTSKALSAGWVWDIGLQNRRGTGYVYSSQFISAEDAEAELRAHEGPHCAEVKARHLKFKTGRVAEAWKNNVVAIGLSAGFLEPLESTGLFFIEEGVDYLCELFPRLGALDAGRRMYNDRMRARYAECLDFINLHYVLSRRDDTPFWREVTKPERMTPSLRERLADWDQKPPSRLDFTDQQQLFSHINFEFILYGMDWAPKPLETAPPGATAPDTDLMERIQRGAMKGLRKHSDYVESVVSKPPPKGRGAAARGAAGIGFGPIETARW
jgi:tryptophan halogenase